MRVNTTKTKLQEGRVVFGGIVGENAPAQIETLGALGFDFIMIDCEHGPMSLSDVENLVRACESFAITPLARVPNHAPDTILRFLDRGVQGVIVPHVNTAQQAQAIASAARYHPEGHRSIGSTRAHDYNLGVSRAESLRWQNDQTLVIPMVEDVEAVKNLDAILAVPGVDVIHVAPNDLAQSMGFPDESEVRAAQRDVITRARAAGKYAGGGGNAPGDAEGVASLINVGATFITVPALGLMRVGAELFKHNIEAALQK